jgi:glycosyltransferase involved in cell wall biosynthesis
MITVSIVVPIYNVASYLYQCVDSIVNQTYTDIEIILVNDGSSDESSMICHEFAKADSRITLIEKNNEGLVAARKSGLSIATGEYILNVDGDDWLVDDCVENLISTAVTSNADVVLAGFFREFIGSYVSVLPKLPEGDFNSLAIDKQILPSLIFNLKDFSHGVTTYSWGKLFRRSIYNEIQMSVPNEITIGEDAMVTYPMLCSSNTVSVTHKNVYFYRQRSDSMLKSAYGNSRNELSRIAYMVDHLRHKLMSITDYNFSDQLSCYRLIVSSERTGLGLCIDDIDTRLINIDNIDRNARIALYNSGTFGQNVFQLIERSGRQVVAWFDEDHVQSVDTGLSVSPVNKIGSVEFDLLIICTWSIANRNRIQDLISRQRIKNIYVAYPELNDINIDILIKEMDEFIND